MKTIILIAITSITFPLFSQQFYSKNFGFYNKNLEEVRDFVLNEDTIIVRGSVFDCADPEKSCTYLGNYSTQLDSFLNITLSDEIQSGPSLITHHNNFFLSSEEKVANKNITISEVGSDFELKKSKNLYLPDTRYYSYTIKKSIRFGNKLVIGGQVLDSLDKVFISGDWVDKEKATLYVVDSSLNVDTVLLISPTPGRAIKIEDIAVGSDSVLYISFYNQHFNGSYFEYLKVIYGFDKNFNQVFSWAGPDAETLYVGRSSILVGEDSTIYINYTYNYRTYLFALNPDGTKKWECPFDSTFIQGGFSGFSLAFAKNGDIIGSGQIQSANYDIGSTGYLFRISPTGIMKWNKVIRVNKGIDTYSNMKAFGHIGNFNCITELENNDIVAGGKIRMFQGKGNPLGEYNNDLWIVRTDSNGCIWKDCPYIQDIVTKNNYLPIVAHQNEWVVDYLFPSFPPMIYRYTFTQDSVQIGNHYYHELIYSKAMTSGTWNGTGEFFREVNGTVYKIGGLISGNIERLLYNFNLGTGDTLVPNINIGQGNRKIIGVSTIELNDGVPRKKATLGSDDCGGEGTIWIEGMGDLERLFETEIYCSLADGPEIKIRCFSTNGQLLYQRPDISGCYTSSISGLSSLPINIYPNPTSDKVVIEGDNLQSVIEIQFTDNLGRVVNFQDWNLSTNSIELSISELPNGFYFGSLIYKDGTSLSFKSIKI